MLSKYDMIILINDYQKLRYGNLQESMLCSRKERKRGSVKALFFIVMAIGWILGTILDEMLSQRGIFALIFAILAPVYVLYLQIEAELAEMRGEKGGEEKSTDVQKLFSRTLQECAAAFHEGEYNEQFVERLVTLQACSMQMQEADALKISQVLGKFLWMENFRKLKKEDFSFIYEWIEQYVRKKVHHTDEVAALERHLAELIEK